MGGKGVPCTNLPAYYSKRSKNYLDTRGFGDVRPLPEEEIAASILTEIAVRRAKGNVKLVFLEDYYHLKERAVGFRDLGRKISRIIKAGHLSTAPVFFLFNKYTPTIRERMGMARYPDEEEISLRCGREIARVIESETVVLREAIEKAGRERKVERPIVDRCLGFISKFTSRKEQDLRHDEEIGDADRDLMSHKNIKTASAETAYVRIMKSSLDAGRYGYFNPLFPESVEKLAANLDALPQISPEALLFDGYNNERVQFDKIFYRRIAKFIELVELQKKMTKYSADFLDSISHEAIKSASLHGGFFMEFSSCSESRLKELEREYSFNSADFDQRLKRANDSLTSSERDLRNLRTTLNEAEKAPAIVYKKFTWDESPWAFQWWRSYTVNYNDVTYDYFTENLSSTTHQKSKTEKRADGQLTVYYVSDWFKVCKGQIEIFAGPEHHPKLVSAIKVAKKDVTAKEKEVRSNKKTRDEILSERSQGLKRRIEIKRDHYEEIVSTMRKARERQETVAQQFEEKRKEIDLFYKLSVIMESIQYDQERDVQRFIQSYKALQEQQPTEDVDDISDNLRDPIQLVCPGGEHPVAYQRPSILRYINQRHECPVCRSKTPHVNSVMPVAQALNDVIDDIRRTMSV
ncbi:MAG: hypothetical protein CMM87_02085 [Rickettsiales bacterium]|nr:hypothetical protein [Rickettsiales bacterium]|tara:strand:- start:251 stop:2152 length:1902 start_codon:yes stop_codon:yes gene_type:complete